MLPFHTIILRIRKISITQLLTNHVTLPQKLYKAKFEKEKGKSNYNNMATPPDVQHAMDVAKKQSNVRT